MSVPSLNVATSGTGAAPITADNFNTYLQGGALLATLRAFTGTQNLCIYMVGYIATNDGGQGNFIWVVGTGTDDGGVTTIVPTGNTAGYWSRLIGNPGVNNASNAPAGGIGEYVANTTTGVSLTNNTAISVTSISLTAGDWDVGGSSWLRLASGTSSTAFLAGLSTTNNTLPLEPLYSVISTTLTTSSNPAVGFSVPQQRLNISTTETIYLVAECSFGTSTATASATIWARRRR